MRKQLIRNIVDKYVVKMTCAMMADHLCQTESEQEEANKWIMEQRKELNITSAEIKEALESVVEDRQKRRTAYCYDETILN